jgi:hypothetical protein
MKSAIDILKEVLQSEKTWKRGEILKAFVIACSLIQEGTDKNEQSDCVYLI